MPPRSVLGLLAAAALLLGAPAAASADPYLPPAGKVLHGVAAGDDVSDFRFRTGRPPAVWQQWIQWGGSLDYAFDRVEGTSARLMLHLSTARGQDMPGRISPGAIARGDGDGYLVRLGRRLAGHGRPVYLRLLAEMNNCDLAYSSHDCNGRVRDADHAPAHFKQAWRRIVTILRGGDAAAVDARLRRLGLPGLRAGGDRLPEPQVAFMWSPMTGGSPMIAALRPQVFWPGSRFVDWVSTSFYSRFPNFHFLEPYYRRFAVAHRKPFAFGEWAMWGADEADFPRRLFAWVHSHDRVRMMIYNQGDQPDGPFRLRRYPRAQRVIREALSAPRFDLEP